MDKIEKIYKILESLLWDYADQGVMGSVFVMPKQVPPFEMVIKEMPNKKIFLILDTYGHDKELNSWLTISGSEIRESTNHGTETGESATDEKIEKLHNFLIHNQSILNQELGRMKKSR